MAPDSRQRSLAGIPANDSQVWLRVLLSRADSSSAPGRPRYLARTWADQRSERTQLCCAERAPRLCRSATGCWCSFRQRFCADLPMNRSGSTRAEGSKVGRGRARDARHSRQRTEVLERVACAEIFKGGSTKPLDLRKVTTQEDNAIHSTDHVHAAT